MFREVHEVWLVRLEQKNYPLLVHTKGLLVNTRRVRLTLSFFHEVQRNNLTTAIMSLRTDLMSLLIIAKGWHFTEAHSIAAPSALFLLLRPCCFEK